MAVKKQVIGFWLIIAMLIGFAGCGSSGSSSGGGASMEEMAAAVDAQRAAEKQKEQERLAAERAAQQAARNNPPEPKIETVTARSPQKGRSLEGGGYLATVTGTRFWAEHQIILNNIIHATRLYEAEHSRYPRTQKEFMEGVIKPNEPATSLPPLPPGWEYYYDPQTPLELKMINRGGNPAAVQ